MSRELYRRTAPHLQRIAYDSVDRTTNPVSSLLRGADDMNNLLLLQRSNEELKDYIKVAFCPELYGSKIRKSGINNFITKGYSANSIGRELSENKLSNGTFETSTGWSLIGGFTIANGLLNINQPGYNFADFNSTTNLTLGKRYKIEFDYNFTGIISLEFLGKSNLNITGNGLSKFTQIFECSSLSKFIRFYSIPGVGNAIGWIDNIVVSEYSENDLTQTSSANQPFLDKIAPTEKLSAKNPNGGSNYLTHPTVSFGASDEWSVETVLNWNGTGNVVSELIGGTGMYGIGLRGNPANSNRLTYTSSNLNITNSGYDTSSLIGKDSVITLIGDNGVLKFYVNGILVNVAPYSATRTTFNATTLLSSKSGVNHGFNGTIHSHHIFSKALSPTQVAERASILKSIFPEIPSVSIGEQIWSVRNFEAVVTPQGTLIPEMQANSNVERITNAADREFTSGNTWSTEAGWSTDTVNGKAIATNVAGTAIYKTSIVTGGRYYKVTYTIDSITNGSVRAQFGAAYYLNTRTTAGTYTEYMYATSNNTFEFRGNNFSGVIDNVSVQEIGWSGSQELYDGIYAQTSGTVEQKTYAAVKAAAMWRSPGDSISNAALYGKKYNIFARKLLAMDIAYYNTANPTTPWGYDLPTKVQLDDIKSLGANVNKLAGNTLWTNSNGKNSTGLSIIGGGIFGANGAYSDIKLKEGIWTKDTDSAFIFEDGSDTITETNCTTEGHSIRLIKV